MSLRTANQQLKSRIAVHVKSQIWTMALSSEVTRLADQAEAIGTQTQVVEVAMPYTKTVTASGLSD